MAGCVSGGAVAEAGGAATVSGGLVRSPRCSFSLCFFSVCFFSFVFGLVLPLFPFLFSVFFVPLFSFSLLRSTSSSLSPLFFSFFLPVSPLFFSFFFSLRFLLRFSAFLASIYRGQGCCFLQLSWGSSRLVGHWARLPRFVMNII